MDSYSNEMSFVKKKATAKIGYVQLKPILKIKGHFCRVMIGFIVIHIVDFVGTEIFYIVSGVLKSV